MNKKVIKERVEWFFSLFVPKKVLRTDIYYLSPNQRLSGKKIIITGGGHGLGYAMAKKFKLEGAEVLITGRNEEILKKSSDEIGCSYVVLDITQTDCFTQFIQNAEKILGGINVLVNNAGISLHEGDIQNVTEDSFDKQIDTNLKGGYFLSKLFIKYLQENKQVGNILFLSSERGQYADDIPYGLTKAAINSLTRGLAMAYRKQNIRVNAVAPGITATSMTGHTEDTLYMKNYSTGRCYLPEEVAEVACFLISDASGCLSGQILYCDNGFSNNSYKK